MENFQISLGLIFQLCQIHENRPSSWPDTVNLWWRKSNAKQLHFSFPAKVFSLAILVPKERRKKPIADALFGSSGVDINSHRPGT